MKKNIMLALLVLTNVCVGIYAFQKKAEADRYHVRSLEARLMAEEQRMLAIRNEDIARQAALEAQTQRLMAEQNLMDCLAKK